MSDNSNLELILFCVTESSEVELGVNQARCAEERFGLLELFRCFVVCFLFQLLHRCIVLEISLTGLLWQRIWRFSFDATFFLMLVEVLNEVPHWHPLTNTFDSLVVLSIWDSFFAWRILNLRSLLWSTGCRILLCSTTVFFHCFYSLSCLEGVSIVHLLLFLFQYRGHEALGVALSELFSSYRVQIIQLYILGLVSIRLHLKDSSLLG